jgi:hypothetical protein
VTWKWEILEVAGEDAVALRKFGQKGFLFSGVGEFDLIVPGRKDSVGLHHMGVEHRNGRKHRLQELDLLLKRCEVLFVLGAGFAGEHRKSGARRGVVGRLLATCGPIRRLNAN